MLESAGRLLLVRRAASLQNGGRWCFPGGRLEPGEDEAHAVRRELEEELGLHVEPLQRLGSVRVDGSDWDLGAWRVAHVSGEIVLQSDEVSDARWMTPAEVAGLGEAGLPSNARVLELLAVT